MYADEGTGERNLSPAAGASGSDLAHSGEAVAPAASGSASDHTSRAAADADARDDAVFKALANSTRRRILDLLRTSPLSTGEVCEAFPALDRTTVLQHIRVLERAELLTGRKDGRTRVLALAPLPIKRIHDRWIGDYTRAAVDLLADLDA